MGLDGLWEGIFGFINVGHAFSVTDNYHVDGCAITRDLRATTDHSEAQQQNENNSRQRSAEGTDKINTIANNVIIINKNPLLNNH